MAEYEHIIHPFEPLFCRDSRVLILGSLPSVKSREQKFFYGHPQNRFWRMIAGIYGEDVPVMIEEKKALILGHQLALWDVIGECDIIGSSDSSIKHVVPTDLASVIEQTGITKIICNGKTSGKYYQRFQEEKLGIKAIVLPSTSPANAACSLEKLIEEWGKELKQNEK